MRRFTAILLLSGTAYFQLASTLDADVVVSGDVTPTPNSEGGTISNVLSVGAGVNSGATSIGTMTVDGGTTLSVGDGIIGDRLGANGVVAIQGTGTQWLSSDDVFVGNSGYGELSIRNQGWVGNNDDFTIGALVAGRGWVEVRDSATVLNVGDTLTVGGLGAGTLEAEENARIISDIGVIGGDDNSFGSAVISSGASWRNRTVLVVGGGGAGSLLIENGGLVENSSGSITTVSGGHGQVVVRGPGSLWMNRDDLTVGDSDSGELRIEDSGTVLVYDDMDIKRRGTVHLDNGRLTVDDSISNSGAIAGSGFVQGPLNITSTGSLRANSEDAALVLSSGVTNAGLIEATNGEAEFQRAVTNEETGLIAGHDGVLRFGNGLVNNGKLAITAGSTDIHGDVGSTATGSIQVGGKGIATFYNDVTSAGSFSVEPESTAVFLGNMSIAANGALRLSGLASDPQPSGEPSIDDPFSVAGVLSVDGNMSIFPSTAPDSLTEPTSPGESVTLSLVTAGELVGAFDQVNYGPTTLTMDFVDGDGRSFRSYDPSADALGVFRTVDYSNTSIEITNYTAIGGDTDGDRDVDFADFLIVSGNFGKVGLAWVDGDFDGDGGVRFSDFLLLSDNFGTGVGGVAANSVPEPDSMLLCVFALIALAYTRRRVYSKAQVIS